MKRSLAMFLSGTAALMTLNAAQAAPHQFAGRQSGSGWVLCRVARPGSQRIVGFAG